MWQKPKIIAYLIDCVEVFDVYALQRICPIQFGINAKQPIMRTTVYNNWQFFPSDVYSSICVYVFVWVRENCQNGYGQIKTSHKIILDDALGLCVVFINVNYENAMLLYTTATAGESKT